MKYLLLLWKRQSLFIRLTIALITSTLVVLCIVQLLELARTSEFLGLPWGEKPNNEVIMLRAISMSFINMCSIYSYDFLKECESKKVKIRMVATSWYIIIISWLALVINYFNVDDFVPIENIITIIGMTNISLAMYWLYFFAYIYSTVKIRLENEKKLSREFLRQAVTDNLTGLRNRTAFVKDLHETLETCNMEEQSLSVLFLDLDRFKYVNDTFGHSVGDLVLIRVAEMLRALANKDRIIYRLGGDEFTIINMKSKEDIFLSETIIKSFEKPLRIDNKEIYTTASIGIARYPEAGNDVDTLTRNADSAMYMAKEQGKNRFWIYTKSVNHNKLGLLELENDLRKAISEEQFFLNFQPIIDIKQQTVSSFEVLIRWKHPTKGIIPPGVFIPLAEETGLIVPIGEWVLKNACLKYNEWIKPQHKDIKLAVNLSARQIQQNKLVNSLEDILVKTNFEPKNLELEVTESSIMKNLEESIERLRLLRDESISIIVDDFGIEYSSLNYLKLLPINTLKIDKSFVDGILKNRSDRSIIKAMIEIGHSLDITVIAEGVENKEQYEYLKILGCDRIQGYYFSKPVEVDRIPEFFRK